MASAPRQHLTESRKLYGRKKGRPLGLERQAAVELLLPALSIAPEALSENHTLDPASLFPHPFSSYCLEIGFGQGEHVTALMKEFPNVGFLAAEPFINGVAGLLKDLRSVDQPNVRILQDDGMKVAYSLKSQSIERLYILNPDPWPKKRHHERRIINQAHLDAFATILKPGGHMILSTDVPDLADWMITQTVLHPAFHWEARSAADWRTRPEGWHPTRYELKKANHSDKMCYLLFTRK